MSSNDLDKVFTTKGFHFAKGTDLRDMDMANRIGECLNKHYPGYMWGVGVHSETGMIYVQNFSLSGEWGFNLHYSVVQEDVELKIIMRAGGEILERYRLSRGRLKDPHALDDLGTDGMGRYLLDRAEANQEWH